MPRSISQAQLKKILTALGITGTAAVFSAYWTTLLGGHIGARLLRVDISEKDMVHAMKINAATTSAIGLSIQLFQNTGHLKSFEELLAEAPFSLLINFIIAPTALPIFINTISRKDDQFAESIALVSGGIIMQMAAILLFLVIMEILIRSSTAENAIEYIAQKVMNETPEQVALRARARELSDMQYIHRSTFFEPLIRQFNNLGRQIKLVMNSLSVKNIRLYVRKTELLILEPVLKFSLRRWHADHDPLGHYYTSSIASLNFDAVRDMKNLLQWCYDNYSTNPNFSDLERINSSIEEILYIFNMRNYQTYTLNELFGQRLRADALTKLAPLTKIPSSLQLAPSKPETNDIKVIEGLEPALANDESHPRKKKKKKKKREVTQSPAKSESPRNSFFQPQQSLAYGSVTILKRPDNDEDANADKNEDEKPDALPLSHPSILAMDEKPVNRPSEPTMSLTPALPITLPTAPVVTSTPETASTELATSPAMNEKPEPLPPTLPVVTSPVLPTSKPMLFRSLSAPASKPILPTPPIIAPPVTPVVEVTTEIARVILTPFEKKVFALIKSLLKKTESQNYKIYIVGGWAYDKVREVALGMAPCQYNDIDLVTDIPQEVLLRHKGFHKVPQVNGLFTSKLDDIPIDIIHEADLTSLDANVKGRDFMTFYIDEAGRVFDPTYVALAKLQLRQLSSVHDIHNVFNEDPLIILRAIYLSTKRSLDINDFKHMILNYSHRLIPSYNDAAPEAKKYLHPHRMNLRIKKIFSQHHALENLSIMKDLGLLEILFPSIYPKMLLYYDWIWTEMTNTNKLPWPKLERIYAFLIASALGEETFTTSLEQLNDTGNDITIYPKAAAIWQSSILFQGVFESADMLYNKLRGPLQSYRTFYMNKYAAQFISLPVPTYPVFGYAMRL